MVLTVLVALVNFHDFSLHRSVQEEPPFVNISVLLIIYYHIKQKITRPMKLPSPRFLLYSVEKLRDILNCHTLTLVRE